MKISYNKLWKIPIDKNMKQSYSREVAKISPSFIAKLGCRCNITTDVLLKICEALDCNLKDIIETVRD